MRRATLITGLQKKQVRIYRDQDSIPFHEVECLTPLAGDEMLEAPVEVKNAPVIELGKLNKVNNSVVVQPAPNNEQGQPQCCCTSCT